MAEQENKNVAEEQEQNKNEEEKENKEMSEEKNEEKGKVKEKKKTGKGKKLWNKIKDNGRVIGAAAGGIAFGVLSTLGIEKLGEHFMNKKNAQEQQNETVYYETNDDGTYNDN